MKSYLDETLTRYITNIKEIVEHVDIPSNEKATMLKEQKDFFGWIFK